MVGTRSSGGLFHTRYFMHSKGQETSTTPIHMSRHRRCSRARKRRRKKSLKKVSPVLDGQEAFFWNHAPENVRVNSAEDEKLKLALVKRRRARLQESFQRAGRFVIGDVAPLFIRKPRRGRHRNQRAFVIGPKETRLLSL